MQNLTLKLFFEEGSSSEQGCLPARSILLPPVTGRGNVVSACAGIKSNWVIVF